MTTEFPTHANIVIIGGGIIGCSTAYHLAKLGCRDIVLLERAKLTSGTTWHSAAMVRQLRSTISLTQLTKYSAELYQSLEAETGQSSGWINCGSLSIANNPDRLIHIRRQASLARAFGIEVREIDRQEIKKLWPIANTEDLIAGIFSPSDGRVSPSDVCAALVKAAKAAGVRIIEDCAVTGFGISNGRVGAVKTARGEIACETAALCGGLWSREIAKLAGVSAPLQACEHLALITKPFEGIYPGMPILGDHDGHMYIRDEGGGLMVGCFEPNAAPVDLADLPADFAFDLLDENWDQFEPIMGGAIHRIPALETAEVRSLLNGPESFTLDNNFMLGEAPELERFFLCCGMNSVGMASGGGAGRALAEWIVAGEPTMDLWAVDVRRFSRIRNNASVVRERAAENLSLHYALALPGREFKTGRGLRLTPFYERLRARGAEFGERAGWERASWFQPRDGGVANELSFGWPAWYDRVAAECRAARETVAVFDQSSLGKLLVQGRDAERFLQRVCAGDVGLAPGRLAYTPILNRRGGYDSDVVVLRLSDDAFLLLTGAAQPTHDLDLLRRRIEAEEFVTLTDMTSAYAVLSVMGPRARDLLKRISPERFDNAAFPFFSHREIELGGTVARAARLSYVGELGWEIYLPSEAALPVYDRLTEAGEDLGLRDAGTFALNALRLEKGYCAWGHDIGPDDTPLAAGLEFTTKLRKQIPFVGREALERQKAEGPKTRRVLLAVDDPEVVLLGSEPIVIDGEIRGQTSSATYSHTLGRSVAMGYVKLDGSSIDELVAEGRFEVEVALDRFAATASLRAFHDPDGLRPRADDAAA
jgi:4-methylaminobutanoate oxidase (formaldehyde-forming)